MTGRSFHIESATWSADEDALREVREQVFVIEQGVPIADELDAMDASAHHVLARDSLGQPIGTGRLIPPPTTADSTPAGSASIGRMAVLPEWRGRGVGAAILRALLQQARALGWNSIELHAQSHAQAFYAGFGFEALGDEFDECGIPHRLMRQVLSSTEDTVAPTDHPRRLDTYDETLASVISLLADTRYELMIHSRDLDAALFDVPAALDELRRIALSGRRARIRILLQDARKPVTEGHRLIALAQRLPSSIELRTPVELQDTQYPSAFLLNDRGGFLFRVLGHRFEGVASSHAPARQAQLREYFNQVWERSLPSTELRTLGL